jgi:DnaA family protein
VARIMKLGQQIPLGLALSDEATFSNFFIGNNAILIKHLVEFSNNQGEHFIFLSGASGSGKTHLLQACCHCCESEKGIYLDFAQTGLQPEVFVNIEYLSLICLDNVEAILGDKSWELSFFNLYNRCLELGTRLLLAAPKPPAALYCLLPDLASRLRSALIFNIHDLNDEQKLTALQMRAANRGLELTKEAGNFLLHHYPRKMKDLFRALEALDHEAMISKHRLTIPFIKHKLHL